MLSLMLKEELNSWSVDDPPCIPRNHRKRAL